MGWDTDCERPCRSREKSRFYSRCSETEEGFLYIIYLSSNQSSVLGWRGQGERGFSSALQGESGLRGNEIFGKAEMGKGQ